MSLVRILCTSSIIQVECVIVNNLVMAIYISPFITLMPLPAVHSFPVSEFDLRASKFPTQGGILNCRHANPTCVSNQTITGSKEDTRTGCVSNAVVHFALQYVCLIKQMIGGL